MFSRLESLIGKDNLIKLNDLHVLIVGIGGVGGYALEILVRSNIGELTIVDKDIIDLSNLNRQLITNNQNIGKSKVQEAKLRALSINPKIKVNYKELFVDDQNIDDLFKIKFDYVIDACDHLKTKILLINKCLDSNIKIISCLGTARKMDPSKLKICKLKDTKYDPLARLLRKEFKNREVMVVSSEEKVINNSLLGSNSFVPATAGLLCASYIVNDVVNTTKVF